MTKTYETINEYEARLKEITKAGWSCTDAEADALLAERKKLHAEMHEFFPEYFKQSEGLIRYAVC